MKKFLVTGGAGFVGGHMIDALLKKNATVRVLDNFSCASRDNLKPYKNRIEIHEGDIRDPKAVARAVKGMDVIFHFAAIRSVAKSVEDPKLSHEVNATGAFLLLDAAHKAGVKHFIFTSTSATYGEALAQFQKEEAILKPISPYGIAKLAAEGYLRYYWREHAFPTTSVRIFNVYGPRQNPESKYSLVVPGVLSKIFKGQAPVIDGDGRQSRDFVYIDDILDALFKIMGNKKSYGKVYNLGYGHSYSINDLVNKLLKLTKSGMKPKHGPRRPGDPDRTCADISLIGKELGWNPKVGLDKGLANTVSWYQKKKTSS